MGAINGALGDLKGQELISFSKGTSLSLAPQLSYGSEGFSLGANLNFGFSTKHFQAGVTAGANLFNSNVTGGSGIDGRIGGFLGYTAGKFQTSLSTLQYITNGTSQRTSNFKIGGQNWNLQYENDWHPIGISDVLNASDGGDRFRTAALKLSIKDASIGFNLFTGDPGLESRNRSKAKGPFGFDEYISEPRKYRLGAAYLGYKKLKVGVNSEYVRHGIQNYAIHRPQGLAYFPVQNNKINSFYRFGSQNPLSLW